MFSCEYPKKEILQKQIEMVIKKLPQITSDTSSMFYIGKILLDEADKYVEPVEEI